MVYSFYFIPFLERSCVNSQVMQCMSDYKNKKNKNWSVTNAKWYAQD